MDASALLHPDVLGVIVGFAGIILGFIFYRRSKERIRPCFASFTEVLIIPLRGDISTDVKILYKDRQITNLYRSIVYFWNGGNKTLDHGDIATTDPIVLHFEGASTVVLKVNSVKSTRPVLKAAATQDQNLVSLSFEFLDRGDGLVVETFYTGVDANIRLSGTVKGVKQDIQQRATTLLSNDKPTLGFAPAHSTRNMLISSFPVLAIGIILTIGGLHHHHFHHSMPSPLPLIFGLIFIVASAFELLAGGYFYSYERIPTGLRKYK